MNFSFLRFALPFAALALVAPASAQAQKNSGSGTSSGATVIPGGTVSATYVINKSGSYVLGGDRVMSNAALHNIEILAPDVTLDLAGFALAYPGGSNGAGNAVNIPAVENVEIRKGSITNAALRGVNAGAGKGLRLIDLRITGAAESALYALAEDAFVDRCHAVDSGTYGIALQGKRSEVRNSVVSTSADWGIFVGTHGRIIDNNVSGAGRGMSVQYAGVVEGNVVSECKQFGISTGGGSSIRKNHVVNNGGTGIRAWNPGLEISDNFVANTTAANGSQYGLDVTAAGVVIRNNRFYANGTNVKGAPIDAGGNIGQ